MNQFTFWKNRGLIAFLFCIFAVATACSDDKDEPKVVDQFIVPDAIVNQGLSFAADGPKQSFSVTSTQTLNVTTTAAWCHTSVIGTAPNFKVEVSVDANTTANSREANLSIKSGKEGCTVHVTQAGAVLPEPEPEPEPEPTPQPTPVPAGVINTAELFGLGWNLGNHMDAHVNGVANETSWGNARATQATFTKVAASGVKSVRIPVTWMGHFGEAPDYKLEAAWLNRVGELVGYAKNAGLKVIINIHHDGAEGVYWLSPKKCAADAKEQTRTKAQIAAIWGQIAEYFKNEGDYLVFEAFNEIHDGGWGWGDNRNDGGKQYRVLNEWNQTFVDAVRATGAENANRVLAVPGYCTNPDLTMEFLTIPKDTAKDRLLVAIHCYDPTSFTLENKYSEWGHTGATGKKETWGDEQHFVDLFSRINKKFIANGIPVYIGEFGCIHHSAARAEQFRKYYLEYVCKVMHDNGIGAFVWDNGTRDSGKECHGYFNHATGDYINNAKTMIEAMVKAYTNTDPAYTLDAVYKTAP